MLPFDKHDINFQLLKPYVQNLEDGGIELKWQIETIAQIELSGIETALSRAQQKSIVIRLDRVGEKKLTMLVTATSNIEYENLFECSLFAILQLEQAIGEIAKVQEIERQNLRKYFLIVEDAEWLDKGKTSLMIYCERGEFALVEFTLNGADLPYINQLTLTGMTALMYAAVGGYEDIVRILIEHGANPRLHGSEFTPLETAIKGGKEIVEALINAGADVNQTNIYGETAIMYAASIGNVSMLKYLIDQGADINIKTKSGKSAIWRAMRNSHVEAVKLLREYGALE